jgi:hypothetical protein
MEPLMAWAFLSVVVERILEVIARLFPILDEINIKQFNIKMLIALAFGSLFAFGGQLDFFQMVNISFDIPYVGQAISALFIMAGSNYIHDLISAVNRTRQEQEVIVIEVEKES